MGQSLLPFLGSLSYIKDLAGVHYPLITRRVSIVPNTIYLTLESRVLTPKVSTMQYHPIYFVGIDCKDGFFVVSCELFIGLTGRRTKRCSGEVCNVDFIGREAIVS